MAAPEKDAAGAGKLAALANALSANFCLGSTGYM
jgi:hypothetical protein